MGHLKTMLNSPSPLLQDENVHPISCPITLNKTSTNCDKNAPSQTLAHFPHLYLLPPLYPAEHQCKIFNDSCNLCVRNDIPLAFMNIIKNYSNIFSTNKYNIPKLKIPPINIRTNSDKIIALRPYRTSLSDQREIQEQVGKMLEYDIIEPSFSPYSSPVTLVTKKDKTKLFCVDYRRLNEIIFPDVHPLPLIENILDKLANAKIYSRADFSSAYWSIEISPPDRNLLSFVTLEGQYNFKRLPYGIKIGPQVYERAVSQILQRNRLGFIAHYFDDFIIFSNSIEEHLDHLQQFFDMCNRENFKLNYNKCDFFKTTIEFLGYTISSGTYTPLVKNLDVINAIKVPTSVKSLQSFLGSINVYNKFIKDHARIRSPLNNLLKKDTPWHWDAECQHSFDTLKECLTTKPVLHLFKEGLPCQLFCDASLQGIAGILKQQHPDGTLHPVQYYSRALRPHEKNYTITKLECLAVIDSVEKFRIYLAGVRFTIFTDHHALQWLKTIKNPTGRLFRWSLKMSAYEYDIKYIKGKTQYEADLLSRNPLCGFLTTTQIIEKQPQLPPSTLIKTNIDGLHTIKRKGIVKIIVPPSLQHTLINKLHLEYNHPGVSQMIRLISTQYTWCGMTESIVKYNRSCPTCQLIKKQKGPLYGRLERPPIASQPYDMLSIDTISGFSKYDLNNHVNPYPNIIESRKLAIQRTNDRHDKEKIKYDNKHKNPHFDTGDLVLIKAYHHPNSDTKWQWDDKCQQAFTALKESLTRKPVLHLYQDGLPCRLYCDASTQGIKGILEQVHPDVKIHPTQYYSRALRPHECNYNISELECLAIVESIEKFRIYLSGTKFTVYSDHQALQWLKTIKNPSGRLFRWSLRLFTYDYEIQYLKGTQQHEAGLLSRNPFCGFISARTIKKHQPNITDTSVAVDVNGLHTIRRKGVNRIIIPEALQHSLMNQVHSEYNHPGISQMTRLISTQYYWKGMAKSIQKLVNSCHTCQIIKRPKGKPYGTLGQIPPPQQPFDFISIDTISGFSKYGHSKTYLHVIVDHLTRYAWAFPSKSTSTLTYIQTLKKVLQQGSPKRLLLDRAPAFTSEKFRKFLLSRGIQPLLTTSNIPQANGLIERLNATITGKLRLLYLENRKTSWTKLIKQVFQIYNQSRTSSQVFHRSF
ncbi:hypothetical protein LAZ67_23000839 [Cordylochernes scorpioides]|uniref:RNA-directed DNA polymerase n=1 Tax=Cordylochernes scorpioides TaxID=51811 RepID=A0ABY6LV17_9ARAC|nr:hypothetical protein LAZ67_23000839 [Cordylochernes scorpioides]